MTIKEEFFIQRQGKRYVLYAGLLEEAHDQDLREISTDLIQVPEESNGNVAIVKAKVRLQRDEEELPETYEGIGDASPGNVSRNIIPHLIRMAETRAKARALRDAINIGVTALEEISDGDNSSTTSGGATGESQSQNSKASGSKGNTTASGTSDNPEPQKITDSQKRQIRKVSEELFPSVEDMENHKSVTVDSLTVAEANELLKTLNTMKQQKTEA